MRLRSLAAGLTATLLLGAAALRCALPATPPGPQPFATKVRLARGAVLSLPASGKVDEAALVASLRELNFTSVILESSANERGQAVAERVALAVDLQRDLDADVFIGGYQVAALSGASMDALLATDPAFTACYPGGSPLDPSLPLIEKLRVCSRDVGDAITAELARVSASPRIGCYVSHRPELVATLTNDARAKLHAFIADASNTCGAAKRNVALSPIVTASSGDPVSASFLFRDLLTGTGIDVLMVGDGAAVADASAPALAPPYYEQLHVALFDQPDAAASVLVWANLDAFECDGPSCAEQRPATVARFTRQLCSARARVDGIVATEYLRDLAERPLVTSDPDAGAFDTDVDASTQLHRGYAEWVDSGASCAR